MGGIYFDVKLCDDVQLNFSGNKVNAIKRQKDAKFLNLTSFNYSK